MPNEIYHRSNWGNANAEGFGDVYFDAAATNKLYNRSDYYENSDGTDATLKDLSNKASIVLTPTAYSDGSLNTVIPPYQVLPTELVTNGTFDTDSDWSKTNATISGGVATITVVGGAYSLISQNITYQSGKIYKLTAQVQGTSGRACTFFDNGSNIGGLGTSNGVINFDGSLQNVNIVFTANSNSNQLLVIRNGGGDYSFTVDNVSVKEIQEADFDFSRGSSATRVNEQGLVEDVQILSGELVQNGDFEQSSDNVLVGNNSTFDSGVGDWVSYGAGTLIHNTNKLEVSVTASEGGAMIPTNSLFTGGQSGKLIKVRVQLWLGTMTNTNFKVFIGGVQENVTLSSTPTYYDFYLKPTSSSNLIIYKGNIVGSSGTFFIDNVSVKEVGQNWEFTQANISNGQVTITSPDGSYASIIQNNVATSGKKYKCSLDVISISGTMQLRLGSGTDQDITTIGTKTFYINATSNQLEIKRKSGAGALDATIDNVSMKEVTDDTDLPRIDFTDGTGSLLLEPQRTNLITYSEDFSDSSWAKQSGGTGTAPVVTSDNIISPDGTQNADKIVFDKGSGTSASDLSILSASFASQSNTASFYVKADSPQRIVVRNSNSFVGYDIGTDWTRIEKTDTGGSLQIGLRDGYGVADVPNTATVYLWGAQVEAGSYATSYIPTNGSTVTRSADVANNSGNADLFNDSEGVLYAEIAALADDGTARRIAISDGTNNNRVVLAYYTASNVVRAIVLSGASITSDMTYTVSDTTQVSKIAFSYKQNDFKLWIDGVQRTTDDSGNTPTGLKELAFDSGSGANDFYGNVKCVAVFKEALTDEELQQLTS